MKYFLVLAALAAGVMAYEAVSSPPCNEYVRTVTRVQSSSTASFRTCLLTINTGSPQRLRVRLPPNVRDIRRRCQYLHPAMRHRVLL
jgi:hypothetical protein